MKPSLVTSALVAVIVGFAGSVAVVIAAAAAVGASPGQTASWIAVLCLSMAVGSFFLSLKSRMPVVLAWSTPGAALIAATTSTDMAQAVGAFFATGVLVLLTGLIRPLGVIVARIPASLATALLAGVLFEFIVDAVSDAVDAPLLGATMIVTFLVVRLWSPAWAVIAAIVSGMLASFLQDMVGEFPALQVSRLVFVAPEFGFAQLLGVAVPLYIVTMASQNLPGLAVLRADGYAPPVPLILRTTGVLSMLTAPFCGHTTSLAAITAAICTGPDAHPDPRERWKGGLIYAGGYALLAGIASSVVVAAQSFPAPLVVILAGLALLGPFMGAARAAFGGKGDPFAPAVTFAVTASGITVLSVGAAFWGLLAGLAVFALMRARHWLDRTMPESDGR